VSNKLLARKTYLKHRCSYYRE